MKNKKSLIIIIVAIIAIITVAMVVLTNNKTNTELANGAVEQVEQQEAKEPAEPEKEVAKEYLADKVEIGDYVDICIDYENQHGTAPLDERTTLEGWRVIEVEGNGETGVVKLVSAGNPLSYYHSFDADRDITPYLEMLNDLNKEIVVNKEAKEGFYGNGFASNNLTEVFSASEFVDMSKGIHALGCASAKDGAETNGEIEKLYTAITGKTMTMTQLDDESNWPCSDESLGLDENSKAYQLLANGGNYFIAGSKKVSYTFWEMSYKGWIDNTARVAMGVRPVVTLKAGIKTVQNAEGVWELSL